MVCNEINPIGNEDNKETQKNRVSKLERRKEEVRKRLSRDYTCLKKLACHKAARMTEKLSSDDSDDEAGPKSKSAQPPLSDCRMRNPPKYLSAREAWLKKDLHDTNPYFQFLQNAKNPKWHPPWRPPSPPSGWALYQAQVDSYIDVLADWMKQEMETPGYESTATMDTESLRQMFELDLDGYAARKIQVQPRELRCLRIADRAIKRNEKSDVTPLPEFLNILFRVKQMVLNDICEADSQRHLHAFGINSPREQPKKGKPKRNEELYRWILARKAHAELADWSHILGAMNDTFIGCAFARFVNEKYPGIPREIWPPGPVYNMCPSEGQQRKFKRQRRRRRSKLPHVAL